MNDVNTCLHISEGLTENLFDCTHVILLPRYNHVHQYPGNICKNNFMKENLLIHVCGILMLSVTSAHVSRKSQSAQNCTIGSLKTLQQADLLRTESGILGLWGRVWRLAGPHSEHEIRWPQIIALRATKAVRNSLKRTK